jgi:8-oxo-dGTP pyrophosphatase MutT (NUDIX family)
MSISPYIRQLRERLGHLRLLLPSVSVHVFDDAGRLLLVQQREGGDWSTPGGLIEPGERPADAAVRETWEETGLLVRPERVVGLYGGPECVVRYSNGDEVQYVITAFECSVTRGMAQPDGEETLALQYWTEAEAGELPLATWLRAHLRLVYSGGSGPGFIPAAWSMPAARD